MVQISRRGFLKGTSSLMSLAAIGAVKPRLVFAQGGGNGRNLIQIFFNGGYDSFALFPYYDGPVADYIASVRPNININPGTVIQVGNQAGLANKIGLHPSWQALETASDGKIKIVQMTGTRNYRGGSHSLLQEIHSRGVDNPTNFEQRGWFGRVSETQQFQMFQAWGLGGGNKIDFRTHSSAYRPLVTGSNLANFGFRDRATNTISIGGSVSTIRERDYYNEIRDSLLDMNTPQSNLLELLDDEIQITRSAVETVGQIDSIATSGGYTGNFGASCRSLCKILKYQADTPAMQNRSIIAYLERGGFDTHGGQVTSLINNINDISNNLAVLINDLKNHGDGSAWNNTTFSINTDFGRTTRQNGGAGTDHAHAYSNMVFGGRVSPGTVSSAPSMSHLQATNNRVGVTDYEYRDVTSTIIHDMGIDPYAVFTESGYVRAPVPIFA